MAQTVKNPPAMQETWVSSLDWEDPLEEGMATHSSILAWRIPWTEEPGGLQSMGSHDWGTTHNQHRRYSLLLKAKIARKLNVKVRDRFLPNRKKVKLYWEKIVKLHIYSGLYPPESCSGTPVRCEFCFLRYCECLSQLHLFIQKERKERTLEPGWLKEKKVEHKKKELWQQSTLDAGIFTNFVKSGNQAGEVVENSTLM